MSFKNAHVFVVDADSYPVHRDRLFCGIKNPNKITTIKKSNKKRPNSSYYGLIADLVTIRKDDFILFYQMRKAESKFDRGFRGIFKAISDPFFSDDDIDGLQNSQGDLGSKDKKVLGKCPNCNTNQSENADAKTGEKHCRVCKKKLEYHILPNRVLIEPITLFKDPIDDNTAYIDRNYIDDDIKNNLPVLWTMLFRKTSGEGRARSITHILPEEYKKLEKIFTDNSTIANDTHFEPYVPDKKMEISMPLETIETGELKIEAFLEAWLMSKIKKEQIDGLSEIIGDGKDIEYFGNNVLYGIGGERVDILIIHNNGESRTKATVIELKKGKLKKKDVEQIKDYTKWMAQLVFGDDTNDSKKKIQPILIGLTADDKIIEKTKKLIGDTAKPILLEYIVESNNIKFKRVL